MTIMKKKTLLPVFLLYTLFALVSCQKKEIEKLKTGNTTAASNGDISIQSLDILRYFYKGSNNNNIYSGRSTDGTNWSSVQVNNGASLQSGPAAAWFNNNIYVFHRGRTNNNLYYSVSTNRGDSWSSDVAMNNNAGTERAPAAATFNGKIFVAYVSATFTSAEPDQSNIYYSYSSDGSNWTEVSLPYVTFNEPYIFSYGNKIYISYEANNLSFVNIISSTDGVNWTQESQLPYGTHRQAVAVNSNGRGCLVRTDGSDNLTFSYSDDLVNWTTPVYILTTTGGIAASLQRPTVTFDSNNNRFVVVYKGKTNNDIYFADDRSGALVERGVANGTTTEAPYLIFTP